MNAAAVGVPRDARGLIAAFDGLLGRVVSIRSLALLRVLAGPIVLLHLQPFLSDALDGRIYSDAFYEPYASWYPELPRGGLRRPALPGRRRRDRDVARAPHARCDGHDVRGRRLQPVPLHHALPQQPRVPGDRAGAAGGGAVRARAVDGRMAAPPPRAPRARPHRAGVAAVAAAVRVLGDLRRVRAEQAARPGLVRRHGHLAAGLARAGRPSGLASPRLGDLGRSPTAASTPAPPSSSCSPSCSSRPASGRAARATRPCGSP